MLPYFDEKEGKMKIGYRGPFIIVRGAVSMANRPTVSTHTAVGSLLSGTIELTRAV